MNNKLLSTWILTIFLMLPLQMHAQTIMNLSVSPSNPTTNDTILVVAEVEFGSGPCDLDFANVNISGSSVTVNATYNVGMLAIMCTTTDTVSLGTLSAGTYTLDYNVVSPGSASSSLTFTVDQVGPVPPTILGPDDVCEGSTETYTLDTVQDGVSYQWSCSGSASCSGSDTMVNVQFTSPGTGTVEVTATDTNGSVTESKTVNVHPSPAEPEISGPEAVCDQAVETYTVDNYNSSMDYDWHCSGSASCSNASGETASVSFDGTDSAVVEVMATSPYGCGSASDSMEVAVHALPDTPSVTGPSEVCEGTAETYQADHFDPAYNYTWHCSGSASCDQETGEHATVHFSGSDSAFIEVAAISQDSCFSYSESFGVHVNPVSHPAELTGPVDVCEQEKVTYEIQNYDPSLTYDWTCTGDAECHNAGGQSAEVTFTGDSNAAITINTSSPQGCGSADTTRHIHVNPLPPVPEVSGPDAVCSDSIRSYHVAHFDSTFDYTWHCSGGANCDNETGSEAEVHFTGTDSALIEVTATSPHGCGHETGSKSVEIHPVVPEPAVNGPASVCDGTTETYQLSDPDPSVTYTWHCSGSASCDPHSGDEAQVQFTDTGAAVVEVTATMPHGCSEKSDIVHITVNPEPVHPHIDGPGLVCEDSIASYIITNYDEAFDYTWDCSGSAHCDPHSGEETEVHFSGTDTAYIKVTVSSPHNCGEVSEEIQVLAEPAPDVPVLNGPELVCEDSTFNYHISNYDQALDYTWHCSGSANCDPHSGQDAHVTFHGSDTGYVEVSVASPHGCGGVSESVEVPVTARPDVPVIDGPENVVEGSTETYSISNVQNDITYIWHCSGDAECPGESGTEAEVHFTGTESATIEVNAENDCGSVTAALHPDVNPVFLSPDHESIGDITLYPNPNDGEFNIRFESQRDQSLKVEIYNSTGQRVFKNDYPVSSGSVYQHLSLHDLPGGMYYINVRLEEGTTWQRFSIEK